MCVEIVAVWDVMGGVGGAVSRRVTRIEARTQVIYTK